MTEFISKFSFKPEMVGLVGVEREHFLIVWGGLDGGQYSARAQDFLDLIKNQKWTYELSACQVESRSTPGTNLSAIKIELVENEKYGNFVANKLGLRLANIEVGGKNIPLDIFPDPRYLDIARKIPQEQLIAACRVTGTHIHIGAKNIEHAIAINNMFVPMTDELCKMGDHSGGERLRLYRTMAKNWQPMMYESSEHLFEVSKEEGFTDNPRNCWKLIRISIHGTVELRMFGVTDNVDEILEWISVVKSVVGESL